MSSGQIRFDFEQANRQAQKLDDVADRLEELANKKVENARQELPNYWQGSSAKAFQGKQGELKDAILKSARDLHGEANRIRRIAQIIYEAEMEAWRIANERTYNV